MGGHDAGVGVRLEAERRLNGDRPAPVAVAHEDVDPGTPEWVRLTCLRVVDPREVLARELREERGTGLGAGQPDQAGQHVDPALTLVRGGLEETGYRHGTTCSLGLATGGTAES